MRPAQPIAHNSGEASELADILNRAAPLLTDTTMRTLNNEIDGPQKREPADVARDFIKAHGLVSL